MAAPKTAIISLVMPLGARQTSLGESGTALYDDPFTTYWNPAGLAFSPLASEWKLSYPQPPEELLWITGEPSKGFLSHPKIWASSANKLFKYHENQWVDWVEISLGKNSLEGTIRKFSGHEKNLDYQFQVVRNLNQIKTKEDEDFLVQVKIPLSLGIQSEILAIKYLASTGVLWVSTPKGLQNFDGKRWKKFSDPALKDVRIQTIETVGKTLWVGTNNGLFKIERGKVTQKGKVLSKKVPVQNITGLSWNAARQELYVLFPQVGIARVKVANSSRIKDSWNLYDLEDGLLNLNLLGVTSDSKGHVWVAHPDGLSHFSQSKWEQFSFNNTTISHLDADKNGNIWIGTNKGLWQYIPEYQSQKASRSKLRRSVSETAPAGEWIHHHEGSGLHSNQINRLQSLGQEIWFLSDAGIERYAKAPLQFSAFYEKLLPVLNIPELYHFGVATTIPIQEWGTLGFFLNYVSFGKTSQSNAVENSDVENIEDLSNEFVVGFSYGSLISQNISLGLNFKFFHSDLSGGNQEKIETNSYAVDLGLLVRNVVFKDLDAGIALTNLGPNVVYTRQSDSDPIPLTWNFGLAYTAIESPQHRLLFVSDYHRQTLSESDNKVDPFYISAFKGWASVSDEAENKAGWDKYKHVILDGVFGIGTEYTYANMISGRLGYLHDEDGSRKEVELGGGYLFSDAIAFDVGVIKSLEGQGVRDGQWRFGLNTKF
jgi:hypothetical protein